MGSAIAMVLCLAGLAHGTARAAEVVAPPLMYPAGLWQGRGQAVLRVLNRLDSHAEIMTVGMDETGHYKTLDIAVHRCLERPGTLPGDAAVQATITDTTPGSQGFDGWMVASVPSLSMLQNALYEVHVIACAGPQVAPQLPPLTVAVSAAPADGSAQPTGSTPANATGQPQPQTPGGAPVPLTPTGPAPTPLTPDAAPVQSPGAQSTAGPPPGSQATGAPVRPTAPTPQPSGPAPTPLLPPEDDQPPAAPGPSTATPQAGSTGSSDQAPLPPPTPLVPGND